GFAVWLVLSPMLAWWLLGTLRRGEVAVSLAHLGLWALITAVAPRMLAEADRVSLVGDRLHISRGPIVREIPLSRVRSVEPDLPGNGARRILLLIWPE